MNVTTGRIDKGGRGKTKVQRGGLRLRGQRGGGGERRGMGFYVSMWNRREERGVVTVVFGVI